MNIPQLVKEKILEIDKNAEVILFGSRARGDFHEESDWDFLVFLYEIRTEGPERSVLYLGEPEPIIVAVKCSVLF